MENAQLLVVEDNQFYRDLMIRHLNNEGFKNIKFADDGQKAVELVKAGQFDVILLDIEMPVMDGYQVLTFLKSDAQFQHIPVIVLSASEDLDSIVKCIKLGAEDYLSKPFNPTILRARLDASINKKRFSDKEKNYLNQIEEEKKKVDHLLSITLPAAAAIELKEKGYVEPRRFDNVAVLFCDVMQFTQYCNKTSPEQVVMDVTDLIVCFEEITSKHNMEKIKTIGDEFMATSNLLLKNDKPLESVIKCGLEMSASAPKLNSKWKVKIGVALGPVVAGIVGRQKYQFDLWGDTVNLASRMTGFGKPDVVTMTKETWKHIDSKHFTVNSIGMFDVKGKGEIEIVECGLN